MSAYPSSEELVAMQDQLRAMHKRMHELANGLPAHERDFVGVAVRLTDTVWLIDDLVDRARFIEKKI